MDYRPGPGQELVPLRGAAARIAENMQASLEIPGATSQRATVPSVIVRPSLGMTN